MPSEAKEFCRAICISIDTVLKYWYSRSGKTLGQKKRPTNFAARQCVIMTSWVFLRCYFLRHRDGQVLPILRQWACLDQTDACYLKLLFSLGFWVWT
jgi:hypothetical protein